MDWKNYKRSVTELSFGKFIDLETSHTVGFVYEDLLRQRDMYDNLKDPKVIVDVGAHVGVISVYLAKKYPKAMVYALEPFTPNYEHLVTNVQRNECPNVYPMHIGLGRDDAKMSIGSGPANTGAASTIFGYTETSAYVDCVKLSTFLDEGDISLIDFLKVDTEGAEYSIFKDFNRWQRIKDMYIELHALYPYPNECWNGLMGEMKKKLLNAPIKGKATVFTPDGFKDE